MSHAHPHGLIIMVKGKGNSDLPNPGHVLVSLIKEWSGIT